MGITIKDIADKAGVSIATVSHVINKTRYVSPELAQKVEKIIHESGYESKLSNKMSPFKVGKLSEIALVLPNVGSTVYSQLSTVISHVLAEAGLELSIFLTEDDIKKEKHILAGLMTNKRIAGIILVPAGEDPKLYKKLIDSGVPFLCLERTIKSETVQCVLAEKKRAIYMGTEHLIKSGHENIALLLENKGIAAVEERLEGYRQALADYKIPYNERFVVYLDLYNESKEDFIRRVYGEDIPTAFLAAGNTLTMSLLKCIQDMGLECPKDVSVVGFGDDEWCELFSPPLTMLKQDTQKMGKFAADILLKKIKGEDSGESIRDLPVQLFIRKSTQIIGRGPFGEKAVDADELQLSDREIERLKAADYKVALSFHHTGTEWSRLHENAIRDTLAQYGIKVIGVADAHFDPELQVAQLAGLELQKPDAIIAIPADDEKTSKKFKEISKAYKLIFVSGVPLHFEKDDYVSCISVNERENGYGAGKLMGEYFKERKGVNVGFITHGTTFFATHQRDMAAEQVICESYPNIIIRARESFYTINKAYDVCKSMIARYPEIEGLYVSWERPALEVIRALKEMNREDISIFTSDLDIEVAEYMYKGEMVRGISAQRPYEQGVAAALATASALLGKKTYKYITVQPRLVEQKNVLKAWKEIIHSSDLDFLKQDMQ
jgi:ribose transport system substrate-binding protein